MNDFTKEELIALEDAMQRMADEYKTQSGEYPLLKKLQCMIDNSCDHEFYMKGFAYAQCHKCGEVRRINRK